MYLQLYGSTAAGLSETTKQNTDTIQRNEIAFESVGLILQMVGVLTYKGEYCLQLPSESRWGEL